jgi:hypothetical protein
MVAGASLGQSLHPSRCGAYVQEKIPDGLARGNHSLRERTLFVAAV